MTNFLSRRDLKLLKAESNLPTDTSSGDKVLSAIAKLGSDIPQINGGCNNVFFSCLFNATVSNKTVAWMIG
jgi:hypothetical protein